MNSMMITAWRLFKKDLTIEVRRGELSAMVLMGVVGLSVLISYGAWLTGLSEAQRLSLAPSLSLAVLLMTALSVIGKFSEYDHESGALDGLKVAGVSSDALYLARVASLFTVTFLTAIAATVSLPTLLGLPGAVLFASGSGLWVCMLVALGLAACGALFAPIAARLKVGGMFLLTLLLPLIIPLFFAGCEVMAGSVETRDFWWTVLGALDAIYLAAGLWLHPFVIR